MNTYYCMSLYFNHVAAFLVLPYSSAIAPMTKNPWKKYIFFQSKGKNEYTICTQNINELKQYTLFYKHFDSRGKANFRWFEGSKLLSCCLILYVFIHKKTKNIISEKKSCIEVHTLMAHLLKIFWVEPLLLMSGLLI